MKKRTAFIGAILSLLPLGQPLLIKTGVILSGSAVMLSLPEKVNAESADSYNKKGIKAWKNGDQYAAISYYTKAIKKDPKEPVFYNNRGISKSYISDFKGAINDFNKAIELDNNYMEAFTNRCSAKVEDGDFYGAVSDCNKAIKIEPSDRAFYSRGNAKRLIEDYKGSIIDYDEAIKINPKYAEAYVNRSVVKELSGDIKGACLDAKKSRSLGYENKSNSKWITENCKRK